MVCSCVSARGLGGFNVFVCIVSELLCAVLQCVLFVVSVRLLRVCVLCVWCFVRCCMVCVFVIFVCVGAPLICLCDVFMVYCVRSYGVFLFV